MASRNAMVIKLFCEHVHGRFISVLSGRNHMYSLIFSNHDEVSSLQRVHCVFTIVDTDNRIKYGLMSEYL